MDQTFYDDSSTRIGLTHSATEAKGVRTCDKCEGRMLEEDAAGHKCGPQPNAKINPMLHVEGRTESGEVWRHHNDRRLEAEARARGEVLHKAVNPGRRNPDASNVGAYDKIDGRIRELVAEGKTISEANAIALAEVDSVDSQSEPRRRHDEYCGPECPTCNQVDPSMLQPEGLDVEGGSNRAGKFKRERKRGKHSEPYILASYGPDGRPYTERERAEIAMEANRQRAERAGPGRPPKGKEAKMRVVGYVEPHKVADIYDATGKTTTELLEDAHRFLTQIKEGATNEELGAGIRGLLGTVNHENYGGTLVQRQAS